MSMTKLLGAAALLTVLCVPAIASESTGAVVHHALYAQSNCSRPYHYHYRAYRPRVRVMPRHNYPHKKKKPQTF